MTTSQIIAVVACAAALVAVLGAVQAYRARRSVERTLPIRDGGGVITFPRRMSDAEVDAFKARWQATHGKPGAACSAYQPPTTPADSGLCARCGMYDYKHQEGSGA
ncbi:hypothetical protein [Streptomyces aurantiogriseus]|uniref:Uncharacterized protein n=1 Tax=Streptomyces aurantiogriseus TaxID=66870 RepID=A0A918L0F2_9ACTN|nr:hypothetical protein [Streptomyces aurantiogriseus]GGR61248.1 hypothetical protein GCM10010251_92500 [Streptomyces aurantiogriseus]